MLTAHNQECSGTAVRNSRNGRFFYWRASSILLIVLTIMYGLSLPLNLWLGMAASRRGDTEIARFCYRGVFWNAIVAVLCFTARQLMRRRRQSYFKTSAFMIAAALLIVTRTWVFGLLTDRNPLPALEVVVTWLPMLYAMIYAFRESKLQSTPTPADAGGA